MPVLTAFVLGMFSMGFQLLGSRLLNPWFGSSIQVWAFLISTFLAAFSAGSFLGAWIVGLSGRKFSLGFFAILVTGTLGFLGNASLGRSFLSWLDMVLDQSPLALGLSTTILFFPPVCALAAVTPILIQRLHEQGTSAGFASGVIYAVGTMGNIVGIMVTVFFMIPRWPVSILLWIWTVAMAITTFFAWQCFRRA